MSENRFHWTEGGGVINTTVELVDAQGVGVGTCPVTEAHLPPGRLHRAFSVLLFDSAGRMLLQRRALNKSRFPGAWANTCCSHPGPGADVRAAASRRLGEELGLQLPAASLREVGQFVYQAADPATGLAEHEYDHVLIGECDTEPRPDESEVDSCRWVAPEEVLVDLAERPEGYAPWFPAVVRLALRSAPRP